MFCILDAVKAGVLNLSTPIGLAGSLVTIYDHFRNQNNNHIRETLKAIREKSEIAYAQYCEHRKYREDDLGVPLKEDILGYWETCLQRNVLPSAGDMAASKIASEEEAEIMLAYLMEQWMTIPDFAAWIHDILTQSRMETIAEMLADLPQIWKAASQIKAQLDNQGIDHIATMITPSYVTDARLSCNDLAVRDFFNVDNYFHTMLQVISADADVPHEEAAQAVEEQLQRGVPVIIAGNGGQGKTSLMMRTAVRRASSGGLAVWLALSNKEVITEREADRFFDCLTQHIPAGQSILLCIDNPFEGRESFSSLQARWPRNSKIQLLMAERENRLTLLADPDQDLLLHWFDDAELVVLQGMNVNQDRRYRLKDYPSLYFSESLERRKSILEKSTAYLVKEGAISEADQLSVIDKTLGWYGKPYVSLVELIYRTLFELKKISSKPESIKLDWEEWGGLIRQEFGNVDSDVQLYGIIAAMKVFNTPLPLALFCKYFSLDERKLRNRLCERFVPRHVEPVIYQEGHRTLQPKHDVIAELFFLFNKDKVTVNSLMSDLIAVMDEREIEAFLANLVNKREIRKGRKYSVGKIDYWGYFESIYSRIREGSLNLSHDGKAYLCLGILWARKQKKPGSGLSIDAVLEHIAPEPENHLLIAKLYTEWGIWLAERKEDSAAEEKFLTVIEYNPKQLPARTELGRLLSRQKGREKEAEEFLLEAIRIDPKNLHPHTELGRLLSKQKGREKEAEEFLLEILAIDSKNIQSRTELGRLLSRQKGREKEAEEFLLEILAIDPKNIQSRTELGRLLAKQKGREKEAEEFLLEILAIAPKDIQSRTELGRLLSRQKGREKEAEEFLLEILAIAPKNIQSRTELGRLLSKQKGREKEAEKFLLEAIKINPKHLHSRTVLAKLYESMNKPHEAKRLYQEICEIDPGNRFGEEGLSRLKSY